MNALEFQDSRNNTVIVSAEREGALQFFSIVVATKPPGAGNPLVRNQVAFQIDRQGLKDLRDSLLAVSEAVGFEHA